jgi:hypothetical protein
MSKLEGGRLLKPHTNGNTYAMTDGLGGLGGRKKTQKDIMNDFVEEFKNDHDSNTSHSHISSSPSLDKQTHQTNHKQNSTNSHPHHHSDHHDIDDDDDGEINFSDDADIQSEFNSISSHKFHINQTAPKKGFAPINSTMLFKLKKNKYF